MASFYSNPFRSHGSDSDVVLSTVAPRVIDDHNHTLNQQFSGEAIKAAIQAMHPDKSLRPDGMNPAIFQKFWPVVGDDVAQYCLHSLNSGCLP